MPLFLYKWQFVTSRIMNFYVFVDLCFVQLCICIPVILMPIYEGLETLTDIMFANIKVFDIKLIFET